MPDAIRQFIAAHVPSVERLEVLLLLCESRPRTWTIDEIEQRIRSSRESIAQHVAALITGRLFVALDVAPVRYRFAPEAPALERVVVDLAHSYRMRRVTVIQQIYAERANRLANDSPACST
ncbi:hypothetical protein [Opitutus sp. ER46]|uniref:hypothetical protein n=1 Tax=Opitutus sp. ER46 TaxID=2161864 RepID=UPI000D2FF18D|nr:hypothetical protein [Opitutus sp. ER46]PTX96641.1 hypothetical protein DB354_08260 [Opitutus sp. ER46]